MLKISEKAKKHLIQLRQDAQQGADYFLRVGVESGGCSGLSYKLNFENELKPGDDVFGDDELKIVTDKRSVLYIIGTELDFSDGLNGKGFTFNNPNATRTCSCGESFAV